MKRTKMAKATGVINTTLHKLSVFSSSGDLLFIIGPRMKATSIPKLMKVFVEAENP